MNRLPTPAISGDYVLRAEIELDNSFLNIEGQVLEHFRASTLDSQGRFLLRGVSSEVAGPDPKGHPEFRIIVPAGRPLILLPVPAAPASEPESFPASVRYPASGTAALEE